MKLHINAHSLDQEAQRLTSMLRKAGVHNEQRDVLQLVVNDSIEIEGRPEAENAWVALRIFERQGHEKFLQVGVDYEYGPSKQFMERTVCEDSRMTLDIREKTVVDVKNGSLQSHMISGIAPLSEEARHQLDDWNIAY